MGATAARIAGAPGSSGPVWSARRIRWIIQVRPSTAPRRGPAGVYVGLKGFGKPSQQGAAVKQMEVVGVRVEMPSNQPIVLLKETDGDRYPVSYTHLTLPTNREV